MRSVLDLFGRPSALAGPPAYVRRSSTTFGTPFSSLFRSDRTGQMEAYGQSGTLFQIVNRTAFTVSTAEWQLFRSAKSGRKDDREQVVDHPALDLLSRPNQFFTKQELFEAVGQHFELAGEGWIVVVRDGRLGFPQEMWPVRPDRMQPMPSPTKYLNGYLYIDPDGEKVPLDVEDVMLLRAPSPLDPYRGMGAVGTILLDVYGRNAAREWNNNFFVNNAEPSGAIELPEGVSLSDDEWREMRARWRESHKGVNNAHRVAILEQGAKFVERKSSRKDMEFVAGLDFSNQEIRRAFGYPKPMLGDVDDVNRANADAAETVFARWLVRVRLERWKGLLNNDFLPLYGSTTKGLELDYVNPVPEDIELDNATRDSKINAARTLVVDLKATRESTVEALGLPATLEFDPMPEPQQPAPAGGPPQLPSDNVVAWLIPQEISDALKRVEQTPFVGRGHFGEPLDPLAAIRGELVVNQATAAAGIDLSAMQAEYERKLDALIASWDDVTSAQRAELRRQIRDAVETENVRALAELTADHELGAEILTAAMLAMWAAGGSAVAEEAAAQGVEDVDPADPDEDSVLESAAAMALLLAAGYAMAAGAEALRQYAPGKDPDQVARDVDAHLTGLSDAHLRERLGGMLTQAQNAGRVATLRGAPAAEYYATEVLDKNTCGPCRKIDGQRLPTLDAAMLAYGGGGYLFCEGTWRCRGTMVAIWSTEDSQGGDE